MLAGGGHEVKAASSAVVILVQRSAQAPVLPREHLVCWSMRCR